MNGGINKPSINSKVLATGHDREGMMKRKWFVLIPGALAMGVGLAIALVNAVLMPWEIQSVPMWNFERPETFISQDNKKYTYQGTYPDGTELTYLQVALRVNGGPLLTQVDVPQEAEPYASHYVERDDGIYTVWETDPSNVFLYLPAVIKVGTVWQDREVSGRILKTGETVVLESGEFTDCILVEQVFSETGYVFNTWYAPGVGLIRSEYAESGKPYELLKKIEPLNFMERLWALRQVPEARNVH